jgi:alpha-ketoglutarate-dependent dioxygenase alkB family protein 2
MYDSSETVETGEDTNFYDEEPVPKLVSQQSELEVAIVDNKENGLSLRFHPRWLSQQMADDILSELKNLEYNSDEDSKILIFGKEQVIPRKQVAFSDYGIKYKFSETTVTGRPWNEAPKTDSLRSMLDSYIREIGILDSESGDYLNYVLVNYYRDGRDYIGPHRDNEPGMYKITTADGNKETIIISLSFGATRDFILKNIKNSKMKYPLSLAHGDLLIMRGSTNDEWKHYLPKRTRVKEPRYNLTFRYMRAT